MATTTDEDDTIESLAPSTSLDPYGQLVKMLMPRALCITIYDRMGMPLWLSDGCEGPDLLQLVEESLNAARTGAFDPEDRHGFARPWNGETAYVFLLRAGETLLGALALSSQGAVSRPFSLVQGLLRPVLQVLSRELANECNIGDLRRDLTSRDEDVELLLHASDAADDTEDFEQLLRTCVSRLGCAVGSLLIPARKIAISQYALGAPSASHAQELEQTQQRLFAWAEVQRRTLLLNKAPANTALGALQYKILACPVRHGALRVDGLLVLYRSMSEPDFDSRQARIVETLTRRIAYVLQTAYEPTTGLLTRAAFEQKALALLASNQTRTPHCVAYADVDRLHVINENHGMHVGDEAIARIGETIRTNLPPSVFASRISGDRFAAFLPDMTLLGAEALLNGLRKTIAASDFVHEGSTIELSLSIGLAAAPDTRLPLSHALATAEVACKAAKDRGRGRVEIYVDADRSIVRRYEDVAILGNVRDAIANNRFRMEAQPIIEFAHSGAPRRFELLLRMIDSSGESVPPDKFFSAAERYQVATDIDRWVMQYALGVLAPTAPALQALGAHFAINFSGQSLGDEEFPAFLEDLLRKYSLPPDLVSFEITETAAVANIVRAETLVRRLKDLGHAVALDDFGRGLSSLTYLKSLPVSYLKIDGGLIRDLVGNTRAQAMVTAIVQLARSMDLSTTAECIETDAILATVKGLGVDYGQGFAIGRPQPLEGVLKNLLKDAPMGAFLEGPLHATRAAG